MASNTTNPQTAIENIGKKRILNDIEHRQVCYFINKYQGLPIDCEMELQANFPTIQRLTLKAILQTEVCNRTRSQYWNHEANANKYLQRYNELSEIAPRDSNILLKIAKEEGVGPVALCRYLLKLKYNCYNKKLSELIRCTHLIDDPLLSANVTQCLCSDSQDGPLIDMKRRLLGEEYEFKLKQMAKTADMYFYDENDLRRLGYDKTPDVKMILPFRYKGEIINWIESKAHFADIKTHKFYVQQQLNSYCNRFGTGIIIYWFGYHKSVPNLSDNSTGIIVLDDFPCKTDIELLDLSPNYSTETTEIVAET